MTTKIKNKVKKYTNNYYTKDYEDTFNIYMNGCEESKDTRLYQRSINMCIFWGMNKMSNDWKIRMLVENGVNSKTNMKSIIDWCSVYYVKHTDTYMNYCELFEYSILNSQLEELTIFDIHLEIMDLIKCNNVIEISNRLFSEIEMCKGFDCYETFLLWLNNEYTNKTDTKIKMNSISWYRFYQDYCNEDSENYTKNKILIDKFVDLDYSDSGKCIYKFKYNKLITFDLFR